MSKRKTVREFLAGARPCKACGGSDFKFAFAPAVSEPRCSEHRCWPCDCTAKIDSVVVWEACVYVTCARCGYEMPPCQPNEAVT